MRSHAGDGRAVYARGLYAALRENGVEVRIWDPPSLGRAFGSALSIIWYDIIAPFVFLILPSAYRRYRLIHAAFPEQGLWFPILKIRKVLTVHDLNPLLDKGSSLTQILWNLYARIIYSIAIGFADHIIAVSTQTKDELQSIAGVKEHRITVIAPGIADAFTPRPRTINLDPLIGFVGKLTERKNVGFLLDSLKTLTISDSSRRWRLAIYCGESVKVERPGSVAGRDSDDRVTFHPFVPATEMPNVYTRFFVMIYPSKHEGFGFPILEAQRCGTPVIITEGSRIPDEVARYTLKAKSPLEAAHICIRLIENKELYDQTSREASVYAGTFSWQVQAREVENLYESLLASSVKSDRASDQLHTE